MPEIQIRPAVANDIAHLVAFEHDYSSEYVWQMDLQIDEGQMNVAFRKMRLPRSVRVEYPRAFKLLVSDWNERAGLLVAVLDGAPVGYASLKDDYAPKTIWVNDLVIMRRFRQQGIGSGLLLACMEWARQRGATRLMLDMQPKNYPAYCLAEKLGFDFCGYNDRYYTNLDIALFFAKSIR